MEEKLKSLNLNDPTNVSESDEDEEMQLVNNGNSNGQTNVDVGLIDADISDMSAEERQLCAIRLTSPFFPCKVGGKPAWLDYTSVPKSLTCDACASELVFLLQIYAPISSSSSSTTTSASNSEAELPPLESPDDCFHRVLFVFVCTSTKCNLKSTKLVRSQLRRHNELYASETPPEEEDFSTDADYDRACFEHLKTFHLNLYSKNLFNHCSICGLACTKKCSKCLFVSFCSQPHQLLDWTQLNHKVQCVKYASLKQNGQTDELIASWTQDEVSVRMLNDALSVRFPEREIIIEHEVLDERQLSRRNDDASSKRDKTD